MYEELQKLTTSFCHQYVKAFCDIMDYSYDDYYFVGDNPFGPAAIGDEFWSMTDIFYVISDYDHWIEMHGSKTALQHAIMDWYWYSLDVHEKNMQAEEDAKWHDSDNELPKEHTSVLVQTDSDEYFIVFYEGKDYKGRATWNLVNRYFFTPHLKWKYTKQMHFQPIPCINLKSWLMGARPELLNTK